MKQKNYLKFKIVLGFKLETSEHFELQTKKIKYNLNIECNIQKCLIGKI